MKNKLNAGDIVSVNQYYENLNVHTTDGESFFLSPKDLQVILNQHSFQIVQKRTRTWLVPIVQDDAGNIVITDDVNEKLTSVLDLFEQQTRVETGIRKISGGYCQADYSEHDTDWIYIRLRWGVQNDVDNDVHEEYWKLAWEHFHGCNSIKEIVQYLEPCN